MSKTTKININKSLKSDRPKLRVAAYCRVSTGSDAQLESLETQISHYKKYIKSRSDWSFAGLYYDEGISGTKKDKRVQLMQLIKDCEAKQIDFIITKSISRFSRNTTDCLELVRKLLELGIYIYFEKENINTGSMESELMLSILSSMAEGESNSISDNNKWSIKRRFQNGTYIISYPPYGYDNIDGEMVIIPDQEKIVKEVFMQTLSGMSTTTIADELNAKGIATKKGGSWHPSTIRGMLSNEKYTGDVIFQKTYTDSQFNRHNNNGEKDMYAIEHHHEAIISHEMFDAASALIRQRGKEKGISKGKKKYQNRYCFSGNIICGECGNTFKRRIHTSTTGKYVAWCCNTHIADIKSCSMQYIKDEDIKKAFITMQNKLVYARKQILKPLLNSLHSNSKDNNIARVKEIEKLLLQNTEQQETLTRFRIQGYLDPAVFSKEHNELLVQADNYRKEMEALNHTQSDDMTVILETTALLHFLNRASLITEFDDKIYEKFVNHIIVYSRQEIGFALKCGLTLRERM